MPSRYYTHIDLFEARKEQEPSDQEGSLILQLPLLPEGKFDHPVYGELNFTPAKFAQMKTNFDEKVLGFVPSLNLDHASQNPFAPECRAMGWFKELVPVPGQGLDFVVEFTPAGRAAVESGEYRYISAETADVWTVSTGESYANVILGAALTNWPHFDQMRGIFSQKPMQFSARGAAQFGAGTPVEPPSLSALTAEFTTAIQTYRMGDDLSFEEIRTRLCEAVRAEMAYRPGYAYVEEVYPGFFIYELYSYDSSESRHYRRAYSLDEEGAVTLGPLSEAVEVEEVWVEVARQAFSAARIATLKRFRQGQPDERTAGDPARGGPMSIWDKLRKRFGLPEAATEAEIEAAVEAAKDTTEQDDAPAAAVATTTTEADTVTLSTISAQLTALSGRLQQNEENVKVLAEANQAAQAQQMSAAAESLIQRYRDAGKITPAMLEGDAGKALRTLAEKDPQAFSAVYDAQPAVIDLRSYGRHGGPSETAPTETLEGLAAQIAQREGCGYAAALQKARDERPELYAKYRAAQPGGTN